MKEIGNLSVEELLLRIEEYAKLNYQGHLTIFRFTNGWKISYGTPNLDRNNDKVGNLQEFCDLKEGFLSLIENPVSFY